MRSVECSVDGRKASKKNSNISLGLIFSPRLGNNKDYFLFHSFYIAYKTFPHCEVRERNLMSGRRPGARSCHSSHSRSSRG